MASDLPEAAARARRDLPLVLLASLAFATAGPLGKAAAGVPAVLVACGRTGIAAIAIGLYARGAIPRALRALTTRQRGAVVLAGLLLATHFALFMGGLQATSLAAAVALVSLEPLAVVLASFLAFGLRPTRRELAGLVLATAGAVVVASGAGAGEHSLAGDALVLACVVFYGAYVAAARGLKDALPPLPYAASVYGVASLALLVPAIVLCARASSLHAEALPARALAAIVALGLVPTLVGHTVVQRVARRAPPALVALVSPGETVGSLAIGALVMNAAPTAREAAGAVLVLAGATLAVTGGRRGRAGRRGDPAEP
ncbi:MAG: DMT family transporter [Deltaproteobacteria bacterium]|nr:DMT family transporter [Deltaproteobacteria bacterium]